MAETKDIIISKNAHAPEVPNALGSVTQWAEWTDQDHWAFYLVRSNDRWLIDPSLILISTRKVEQLSSTKLLVRLRAKD